jgi:hypothetical protein
MAKTYTYADLRTMDDEELIEIAVDQMGLGALGEDIPEGCESDEERESLIQTILDAQADTQERS